MIGGSAEEVDILNRKQMLRNPRPKPATGQFWIVQDPDARASLLLILDYHPAMGGQEGFVNLAPVTEDDWLAAEWSLSFSSVHSGLGVLAVIHIDFEQSVGERFLGRCIGQLPAQSGAEFVRVVRAWSNSEAPPSDLFLGCLGQVDIRTRPEWQALDKSLSASLRSLVTTSGEVSTTPSAQAQVELRSSGKEIHFGDTGDMNSCSRGDAANVPVI